MNEIDAIITSLRMHDDGYNQALEDLKFNLEEEKKAYAYNGHSLDTDKWLDDYLKSKLGK